jgi:hypothetical protein
MPPSDPLIGKTLTRDRIAWKLGGDIRKTDFRIAGKASQDAKG